MSSVSIPSQISLPLQHTAAGMPPLAPTTPAETTAAPSTTCMFPVASQSLSRGRYDTHVTIADGSVVSVVTAGAQSYHASTSGISNVFPIDIIDRPITSWSTGPPITPQVMLIT